jgi:hypothetical protein
LPVGVLAPVLMVSDELLLPSLPIVGGLKEALVPVGSPLALSVTVCAELPAVSAAVIEEVPDVPPWVAVTEAGFADNVKEFALTVSVTAVVCVDVPVPVTVIG